MVERLSPLGKAYRPGSRGNLAGGTRVALSELAFGSVVEVACWPGEEEALISAIRKATGLHLPDGAGGGVVKARRAAFGIGPGKFLLRDEAEGLSVALRGAVPIEVGSVTDLSHGRVAFRVDGPRAEWVLSKLYAIDFALPAFPLHAGKATAHHDILTQIQRTGEEAFDLFVFRSFARSFWTMLGHAAEETGYVVK
jgi:heterotetrameric sarcosine oxidase gamma subunit